jgi:hypothetical protein
MLGGCEVKKQTLVYEKRHLAESKWNENHLWSYQNEPTLNGGRLDTTTLVEIGHQHTSHKNDTGN